MMTLALWRLAAALVVAVWCGSGVAAAADVAAPAPCLPVPSPQQVAWQQLETYAFIHFGPNTFSDKEWGYGDAPLSAFDPSALDCDQWVRTLVAAGMRGVILTCKHHDGFCLWPSRYTDYSVRNTPYKGGKGDVVGELAAACARHGIKFGVYLSPWDRHQACYGTGLYREYYYCQLRELLTDYGEVFEVWFDGANGGDGWYGGARERREIDRRTYYDFAQAWRIVRELQPDAIIFSDGGPGCRWVGNEKGYANATNWSLLRGGEVYPGYPAYEELQSGHADGDTWTAAECNTSIRPGWFYHPAEDDAVKSVDKLTDLYYRSVGHNGTFLLNFPVNREGLIPAEDSARAVQWHQRIERELKTDLLGKGSGATFTASEERGKAYSAAMVGDGDYETYWATSDGVVSATLTIKLRRKQTLNRMVLQEYIPLGQRVKQFVVEYKTAGGWVAVDAGEETTTIGYKRILRFKEATAREWRVRIVDARACPCISTVSGYYAR